jgi:dihydrofolate synthase / folylpolyglutamate synthase
MKYSEAVDFLDSKVVLGVKPSLERIRAACRYMGEPQTAYDTIQITGTNGKTSIAHMMSSVLRACEYKVGLFTSPHLETLRERIVVSGRLITATSFADVMTDIIPSIEKAEKDAGEALTYFETITAAAFQYFKREKVDVAVLEVGMGGRWDSTNVVECDVAVITNVDLDHTGELGHTREEIAVEKVGIINEGCVLVTGEANPGILAIMARRCEEVSAEMKLFGRDFRLEYQVPYRVKGETPAQFISVRGLEGKEFMDIKLPLIGKHQAVNAACAIAACQAYTDPRGTTVPETYREALETSTVPGRLEIMFEHPLVITDGAHNVLGMEKMAAALTGEFDYDRLVVVVAILEDKNARGMLKVLGAISDEIIVTENRSARSITAPRLGSYCRVLGIKHQVEPDFSKAMKVAYNSAGRKGLICVTGSLYTVSEARIFFRHQKASREMRQDR